MSYLPDYSNVVAPPVSAVEMELASRSLRHYMTQAWPVLEPSNKFVHGWAVDAVCEHLEATTTGQIRRLVINIPPGFTKSMSTSVMFPTWVWGPLGRPHTRFIGTSYAKDLATRDAVRSREIVESDWYQERWDVTKKKNSWGKEYYENEQTGWRKAASSGSQLTGFRGNYIIVDDPHSVKSAESEKERQTTLYWFSETLPSRLNELANDVIIVIMQRLHERDVSGLILANELGYEHLMLPMNFEAERRCYIANPPRYFRESKHVEVYFDKKEKAYRPIEVWEPQVHAPERPETTFRWEGDPRTVDGDLLWPERFPYVAVEELKAAFRSVGGTYAEAGQLQQRPTPRGGGMFQKQDFMIMEPEEYKTTKGRTARGWDLAASEGLGAKYTAGAKGLIDQKSRLVVADITRFKKMPGAVEAAIEKQAEIDGKRVEQDFPQDPGSAGKSLKHYIAKQLHGYLVRFSPESGDKVTRAAPVAAQGECGNLYLVRGEWNDAFITEACSFPNGEYSDQVDAVSRLYANLLAKKKKRVPGGPKVSED